jgi:smad nuclear-interacting protein 1
VRIITECRIVADGKMLDKPLFVHRSSAFLFGRERKVADIPVDHPSCSSQHAVLQYRLVSMASRDGEPPKRTVKPYIMDLESVNGTYLNGERIEAARYYELRENDMIKFGLSSREYILMVEE